MSVATREVNWGEGLVVVAFRNDGGLKAAVDRIHAKPETTARYTQVPVDAVRAAVEAASAA